jgi:hypothetical protein
MVVLKEPFYDGGATMWRIGKEKVNFVTQIHKSAMLLT